MTASEAENLMKYFSVALANLDEAINAIELLSDKEESLSLRRTVMQATGIIVGDAVAPIVGQHPSLDPYLKK